MVSRVSSVARGSRNSRTWVATGSNVSCPKPRIRFCRSIGSISLASSSQCVADEVPRGETRGAPAEQAGEQEGAILRAHLGAERELERALDEVGNLEGGQRQQEALLFLGIGGGAALAFEVALVERGVAVARRQTDDDRRQVRVE